MEKIKKKLHPHPSMQNKRPKSFSLILGGAETLILFLTLWEGLCEGLCGRELLHVYFFLCLKASLL